MGLRHSLLTPGCLRPPLCPQCPQKRLRFSSARHCLQCSLAWCLQPWGGDRNHPPPCTGTGMPCCRHRAWPHTPGKLLGKRKRRSGQVGSSGIAVGLSHLTPPHCLGCPKGRAGCAGNPHLLWECEMHRSLLGHCPARSEHHVPPGGEHSEMLHVPPASPPTCLCQAGQSRLFSLHPKLAPLGLASACVVSFGSSESLTPAERKACPTAGCLSTC